jgi:hypothetical protein
MNNKPVKYVVHSYPRPLVCSDLRFKTVILIAVLIHRAKVQIMCQKTSRMSESTKYASSDAILTQTTVLTHLQLLEVPILSGFMLKQP